MTGKVRKETQRYINGGTVEKDNPPND